MKKIVLIFFFLNFYNVLKLCAQHISGGYDYSLVICSDSTVKAFGYNYYGTLGDGTTINRHKPITVQGLNSVIAVSASQFFSLALKSDGSVWAWGLNGSGQLGDSTTIDSYIPVKVKHLDSVVAISAAAEGWFSLALKADGTVWGWGDNYTGELGDGTAGNDRLTPVQVLNLTNVISIASSSSTFGNFSYAVKSDGTVWHWGDGPLIPAQDSSLSNVIAITSGAGHCLVLKSDGKVWSWGYNDYGQLGNGTTNSSWNVPVQVFGANNIIAISAGHYQSYALKSNNRVLSWGENFGGQLGDGTVSFENALPFEIPNLECITEIKSGGYHHAIALKMDGTFWAWGENTYGQLGDGTINQRLSAGITDSVCATLLHVECITLTNEFAKSDLVVYPNPLTSFSILQLSAPLKDAEVIIYDMLGKEMMRKSFSGNEMKIEKGNLETGVYFVRVNAEDRQYAQKLIIE